MQISRTTKQELPTSTSDKPTVCKFSLEATGNYHEIKWLEKRIDSALDAGKEDV
jgi:hypothetical protein